MRITAVAALFATLTSVPLRADLVITTAKHRDAVKMFGVGTPATDTTSITWVGKDRMRVEEGDKVTIVRADLNKMFVLDSKAKTVSTLDLPFDLRKYLPAEHAATMEPFMSQMKATLTPTTETKKIKDWNATKCTLAITMPMGGSVTQEIWVTKDVAADFTAFRSLQATMMSLSPGGASVAEEMQRIDGLSVLVERTHLTMGETSKSRDEVTAIETKDAPASHYDMPKDFTVKPFDPMADNPRGGGRGRGGKPGGAPDAGTPPVDKPKDGH